MRTRRVALCGVPGAPVLAVALATDARCEVAAVVTSRVRLLAAVDRCRPHVVVIGCGVPFARELGRELMARANGTNILLLHAGGRHATWIVRGLPVRYLRDVSLSTLVQLIHEQRPGEGGGEG